MKLSTVVEESLGEGESVLAYSQSTIFSQIPLLCFALFFFCGAAVDYLVLASALGWDSPTFLGVNAMLIGCGFTIFK